MAALALLMLIAAPLRVQVVAHPQAVDLAEELRARLAQRSGLTVHEGVWVAESVSGQTEISALIARVVEAEMEYTSLNIPRALELVRAFHLELATLLATPVGVELLGRSLRVDGLARLFAGDATSAAASFASASFVDPDYSPGPEEWPPPARLAYADAVSTARGAAPGIVSLSVEPSVAEVWIDGRRRGRGSQSLDDLLPGQHFVLVACPGFRPVAAALPVQGAGVLQSIAIALEPLPVPEPGLAKGVLEASSTELQVARAKLLMQKAAADALVVAHAPPPHRPAVWVFKGKDTSPQELTAADPETLAQLVGLGLTPAAEVPQAPEPPPPTPWYERWPVWVGVGVAVLAIAGGTTAVVLSQERSPNVTFVIGRGQ